MRSPVRPGTASRADGPSAPRARAPAWRTSSDESLSSSRRAGMADLAADPSAPRARAASRRLAGSVSLSALVSAATDFPLAASALSAAGTAPANRTMMPTPKTRYLVIAKASTCSELLNVE